MVAIKKSVFFFSILILLLASFTSAISSSDISLNSPVDNYFVTGSNVDLNCSIDYTGGGDLVGLSLWTDISGNWAEYDSVSLEAGFSKGWDLDTTYSFSEYGYEGAPEYYYDGTILNVILFSDFGSQGYQWTGSSWTYSYTDAHDILQPYSGGYFEYGGNNYLLVGKADGTFDGYKDEFGRWTLDTSIEAGLTDIGSNSAVEIFTMDSTIYMIVGEYSGIFYGYNWTGTTWVADSTIVTGLGDIGTSSSASVFESEGVWYMIAGKDGGLNGFHWTGTTWVADSAVITNLPTLGYEPFRYSAIPLLTSDEILLAYNNDYRTTTSTTYIINPLGGSPIQIFNVPVSPGNFTWTCEGEDTLGSSFALENRTIRQKNITAVSISPADEYETTSSTFNFICSGEAIESQLQNISLWTDNNGVWEVTNFSTVSPLNSSTLVFNENINSGAITWACQSCTDVGDCDISDNRTLIRKDVEITLNSPINNYDASLNNSVLFNGTVSAIENQIQNISLWSNLAGIWERIETVIMEDFPALPWINYPDILNGLSGFNYNSFNRDNNTYIVNSNYDGFRWNGTEWLNDTSIVAGLPDTGTPTVFEMNDVWYLISGRGDGLFDGFKWNGTEWLNDTSIVAGLIDVGSNSRPSVFQINGNYHLLSGKYYTATLIGFSWNGTEWNRNTTLENGVTDSRLYSVPETFYLHDDLYLYVGSYDRGIRGYKWIGDGWEYNDLLYRPGIQGGGYSQASCSIDIGNQSYMLSGIASQQYGQISSRNTPTTFTQTFLKDISGVITWAYEACNIEGLCRFSENRTVFADSIPPIIIINNPANGAYITTEITLPINITATDDINLDKCYYNLTSSLYNSYNNEITNCVNTTRFLNIDGIYTLTVWDTDIAGNIGTDSITFEIEKESGTGGGGGGSSSYQTITETLIPSIIEQINETSVIQELVSQEDKLDIPYTKILIGGGIIVSVIFLIMLISYIRINRLEKTS